MPHTYHIITYGCQMNKNDSERVSALFERMGMTAVTEPQTADVVLLNSCSVRQAAEDRIFGEVRYLARIRKNHNPNMIIAVTGCMPGRDKDGKMREKLSGADLFFPTRDMVNLPRWLAELRPEFANTLELEKDYLSLWPRRTHDYKAFVSIQTGCNWFCTYCVVPYARGLEGYRSLKSILEEAREAAAHGVLEITLLGQTVNHYQAPDPEFFSDNNPYKNHFAKLLWEMNQLPGIERVHCTSMHPMHLDDEIIDAFGLPKHVNYVHLPLQSGDNEVLKRMNRKYTVEQYLERIEKIQTKYPTMALASDIIVGFCGETVEQFQHTLDVYKKVRYDISYNAMFSPRTGTLAYKLFEDDVPREEKKRRWHELQDVMEKIVEEKNQAYVGTVTPVLVDEYSAGVCRGNSKEMKMVRFRGTPEMVGTIVPVRITKAMEWILDGEAEVRV